MDDLRVDSHKLHWHPQRLAQWLETGDTFPLYMEISPTGMCNHRCVFCALDFMRGRNAHLPTEVLLRRLPELGALGLKSAMYAGEGEPFLHADMAALAIATKQAGVDVAFTTNASRLNAETARAVLPVTSWIKVSCNAGDAQTYAALHGVGPKEFDTVLRNMQAAADIRAREKLSCTLGFQMLLLPENAHSAVPLARLARDLGMDYLIIKPYSQHPQSQSRRYESLCYEDTAALEAALKDVETPSFSVHLRTQAIRRWDARAKQYPRCLALPFWSYMDAGGNIWGCSMFLNDERMRYGNILEQPFRDIWEGPRRQQSLAWCREQLDATQCRVNCRMDSINTYLWELTHPGPHVNFI